jgi:hypothetical protein
MTHFARVFLRERLDGRIHLAAFGKHPAWIDHIDDLGVTTESLAMAKRFLYLEGIAGQLASGAWDRIERSGQAMDFDHRFVWCREKQAIVGAIWASSDGKGRTRFPMVICAQAEGSGSGAFSLYLLPVERLGLQCKSVASQEAVRDFHSRTCAELNVRTFSAPAPPPRLALDNKDRSEELILEALIGLASGLKRVRARGFGNRRIGAHVRVESISQRAAKNLEFWSGYLEQRVNTQGPHLVIVGSTGSPVDLIIGEPEPKDFFCLRANETVLPPSRYDARDRPRFEAEAIEYLQSCGIALNVVPSRRSWLARFS